MHVVTSICAGIGTERGSIGATIFLQESFFYKKNPIILELVFDGAGLKDIFFLRVNLDWRVFFKSVMIDPMVLVQSCRPKRAKN